jgi:hypothetical protein
MTDYIADLVETVERASSELSALTDETAAIRSAPGRWSPKEILGHLIDSAANNHHRFVRAQSQDDLVFPGYAQDFWVTSQRYQDAPWPDLITLWREYNRHLARVMAAVPSSVRYREHERHNLHEIAWQVVPAHERATLDYLMADYVSHLHHHLRQIRASLSSRPAP